MTAIIKWTIWQRRWSVMWWSIGVFSFIFINMIFYPTFKDQAEQLQKSFESLPNSAVQLFGGSTDFFSPVGFLNSQIFFIMLPLLLGILAIGLGSSLIAREEQDKTIEALLSRPISRSKLLLAKSLAGVIIVAIVSLVSMLATVVIGKIVKLDVSIDKIVLATFICFLLAVSFGAFALLLTASGRARGASLGLASTFAIGGYIVSSLAGTVNWLRVPSKVFPFHYYQSESILRGHYYAPNVIFFLAVILACAILTWLTFRRRDLA